MEPENFKTEPVPEPAEPERPWPVVGQTYDCVIAIGHEPHKYAILVSAPKEVVEVSNDNGMGMLEDIPVEDYPQEPGVYKAKLEFWFEQGFCDGYPDPGESEWGFRVKEAVRVEI